MISNGTTYRVSKDSYHWNYHCDFSNGNNQKSILTLYHRKIAFNEYNGTCANCSISCTIWTYNPHHPMVNTSAGHCAGSASRLPTHLATPSLGRGRVRMIISFRAGGASHTPPLRALRALSRGRVHISPSFASKLALSAQCSLSQHGKKLPHLRPFVADMTVSALTHLSLCQPLKDFFDMPNQKTKFSLTLRCSP